MTPYGQGSWNSIVGTFEPDDPKYTCSRCEQEFDNEDDLHEVAHGDMVCDDCYDDYHKCEYCGEEYHSDEIKMLGKKIYCDNCYSEYVKKCELCGEEYFNDDDDVKLCDKCSKEIV